MKKIVFTSSLVAFALSTSACSVINPYHNNFKCSGGSNISYCASVTKVYEHRKELEKEKEHKQEIAQEEVANVDLNKEIQDLKLIIQSKEIERLRSDRKVILIEGNYLNNKEKENK